MLSNVISCFQRKSWTIQPLKLHVGQNHDVQSVQRFTLYDTKENPILLILHLNDWTLLLFLWWLFKTRFLVALVYWDRSLKYIQYLTNYVGEKHLTQSPLIIVFMVRFTFCEMNSQH